MPGPTRTPTTRADYDRLVERLRGDYAAIPTGDPVRLAKRTSNLFRTRDAVVGPGLDVTGFDGVIDVDVEARTADVLGMTTYEHLVDATLPHGLMPLVVPELKTITLGGAVTGLGIESSSFRNGCPHESVIEMDVLTGDGRVLTVTPDGRARRPVRRLPELVRDARLRPAAAHRARARPAVRHAHAQPLPRRDAVRRRDGGGGRDRVGHGDFDVDFVDGTVFSTDEMYLTVGTLGRRGAVHLGLHRQPDLLPVDPAAASATS